MRHLFFSLFCLFVSSNLTAQEPVFKHYTVEAGLPSSEVYFVMQDSKGFIWFATDHGVCRFDGTTFKTFTTNDGLADNTIFEITEDSKKRLWFRSFSGQLSFYEQDKIYKIKNNEYILKLLNGIIPSSVKGGENNMVWLGSEFKNIYQLKMHPDHSLSLVKTYDCNVLDLPDSSGQKQEIEAICGKQNSPQDIIKGLLVNFGDTTILLHTEKLPGSDNLHSIACIRLQDGTWLLYKHNWLLRFNKKGILDARDFGKRIINLYQGPDGDVWICMYKGGVKRFKAGKLFTGKEDHSYFELKSVTSALVDNQGGTWLSTIESGVYFLPSEAFYYFPEFDTLEDKKVIFVGGHSGDVFASLLNGTLYKIRDRKLSLISSSSNVFISVYMHPNGDLWLGRPNEGTSILTRKGTINRSIAAYNTFAVDQDQSLYASLYSSLYKLNGIKEDTILQSYPINIRSMAFWNKKLWLGTLNGLWSLRKSDEKLTWHGPEDPLFKKRISDLESDKKHRLWISTLGAGVLVKSKDTLIQITVKDGLLSNLCNTLLIDGADIWIGTNNGLSCIRGYSPDTRLAIDNYTVNNGLISNEVNQIFRQDNRLWVATNNGLSMINLDQLKPRKIPSPVYITGLTVNGRDTALKSHYTLSYEQNDIRISFVGISYTSGNNITYRYQLKKDEDISEFKYANKNELQFSTLAPGDYIFYAWAKNAEGVWSATPAMLSFEIRPPFWATWWFIIVCAGVIIGITLVSIRWRFRQLIEKSLLRNELNEVKQHALSSRMNPHFMFNALNSIQNYISMNNTENAHRYLSKFSRLMRLILLNSKDTFVSFESEIEALKLYIDLETVRFKDRINCLITIDPMLEEGTYRIPAMVVQPYVENAIKHGLVPKKGKGKLDITFKKEQEVLICTITDNGIGRVKAMENTIARQKHLNHESMGMALTDNRIKLLRSIYKREIKVEITDLYDRKKTSRGTLVTLHFPIISS